MEGLILRELSRANLPYNTLTEDALSLIIRTGDGILRNARNLCLSCMVEAIRCKKKKIGIENVNRVLVQPHWRIDKDVEHIDI